MLMLKNGNAMEFKVNKRIKGFTVTEFGRRAVFTTEMTPEEFIDLLEANGHFGLVLEVDELIENYFKKL